MPRTGWVLIAALNFPLASAAATWIVRPNTGEYGTEDGSSAADAFDGFSDITWGVGGVQAGDTLKYCETFRETLTVGGQGTSSADITITRECTDVGLDDGVISGSNVITAWDGVDGNGEYPSTATFTAPFSVIVDGVAIDHGIAGSLAADEWALDATTTGHVLLGFDPTGHTVEVGVRAKCIDANDKDYLSIDTNCYGLAYAGASSGVTLTTANHVTVHDSYFYNMRGGVDTRGDSSNITMEDNELVRVADGLDANATSESAFPKHIIYRRNDIGGFFDFDTNTDLLANLYDTHVNIDGEGIAATNMGWNYLAEYNTIHDTLNGIGYYTGEGYPRATQTVVSHNKIYRIAKYGIFSTLAGNSTGASLETDAFANWMYDIGSPLETLNANLGFAIFCNGNDDYVPVCNISNNTMQRVVRGMLLGQSGAASELVADVRNNIVDEITYNAENNWGYQVNAANLSTGNGGRLTLRNNTWYCGGNSKCAWYSPINNYTQSFSTWTTQSGETGGSGSDPELDDDTGEPLSGSPSIDSGTSSRLCFGYRSGVCVGVPNKGAFETETSPYGKGMRLFGP